MTASAPAFLQPSPAGRFLVFGGISLIIAGMLLGEIFAIFISHVASAQIRREWVSTLIPAIENCDVSEMNASYGRIEDLLERRGRIMDTHSHVIAYGFVALALALLQPLSNYSEAVRRNLALCLVGGGLVQSACVFTSYWLAPQERSWAWALSAIGGVLVLAGVVGNWAGLRKSAYAGDFAKETARHLSSPSSRILLRTGALLICIGMAFGFYYAWVFVTQHEPRQTALLESAVKSAVANEHSNAVITVISYRALQSRIAIVTAAHSHIIEMGIMAVLLAFVQDFVFLSDRWKRRWAILFCIGGAVMPVCTYCASIFGLVPAGFADAFGVLSVVALFAMLSGLVRYTGAANHPGQL